MKNPFSRKPPVTPIDPLHITAENAFMYSPDVAQPGRGGRLQRFWSTRSKPQQVLLIAGVVTIVFSSLMIGLSFTVGNSGSKSSQSTVATNGSAGSSDGSSSSNSDGTDSAAPSDDLNQNGIADAYEVDTASSEDVSWWQSLLNKMYGRTDTSSGSGDSSSTSSSGSTASSNIVDEDETEYYAEDGDTGSTDYTDSTDDFQSQILAYLTANNTASRFTVASWNVYTGNKNDIGEKAKVILSKAQILGLQEVNSYKVKQVQRITCSSCAYEAYMPSTADRFPIIWNKSYFKKVSAGYNYGASPSGLQVRYIVWVKLQNKSTGKMFYMVNTHLPPSVEGNSPSSKMISAYKTLMSNLVPVLKAKQKDNLPIFVTGDFNVNYRKDNCSVSWKPCSKLGPLGIKSSWELTGLAGISSKQGTHSDGSRLIDYVFTWKRSNVTVNSTYVVGGNNNGWGGSDHKPSFANFTIQ